MERIFQIVAAILIGIAAYFFWQSNSDGAFVSGVFGAASFFLSFRFHIKEKMKNFEEENIRAQELEEKLHFEDENETRDFHQPIERK